MNLYRIVFSHTAPKDTERGIKTYLLADDETEVYDHIDEVYERGYWSEKEGDGDMFEVYDDVYNVMGTETFREQMMRLHGEAFDKDYDFCDAYYGITLHGWELVASDVNIDDFAKAVDLGIIEVTV